MLHQIQPGLLLKESGPSLKLDIMHVVQWKSADPLFMDGFVVCNTELLLCAILTKFAAEPVTV